MADDAATGLWLKTEGRYVTELSSVEHDVRPTCPGCGEPFRVAALESFAVNGELGGFEGRHACGAELLLFND